MPKEDTQWKHGESGNPNGRPPKGYSITEAFRSMFEADPDKKREVVEAIRKKALDGDPTAQKLIWNYMDGMPLQKIGGDKENPLQVTVVPGDGLTNS